MHFSVYIVLFVIFSFIGFITDSIYCSIEARKFKRSGYVSYLPLCPLYGFGGLVLFSLQKYFGQFPWYFVYPVALILILLVEYVGGIYCVKVVKERLWDYSKLPFNLEGHISIFHGTYWLFIIGLFLKYLYPIFADLESKLLQMIKLNNVQEIILLLFCMITFVLVSYIEFRRRKTNVS